MIDTIVLTMKNNDFTIVDWSCFEFHTEAPRYGYSKATCNPDSKKFGYSPRLTFENRFGDKSLRIEFSVPKLLFGNNFDEVEDSDFEEVVKKLHQYLTSKNVGTIPDIIRKAQVSTTHYSKNIVLTDYTTSRMVLSELKKVNLPKWFEANEKFHANGGNTLYLSTKSGSFAIVSYDKIKELEQEKITSKGRVEKDGAIQLSLLDNFKNMQPFEVFRIEIRFCNRKKLNTILVKLKLETELKFENLFCNKISKTILQNYWQTIEDSTSYLTIETGSNSRLIERIVKANPEIKAKKALAVCATMMIIKEVGTIKFRQMMSPIMADRYWYDFQPEVREAIKDLLGKNYLAMAQVGEQLEEFKPVKLKDYPNFEICNVNNS